MLRGLRLLITLYSRGGPTFVVPWSAEEIGREAQSGGQPNLSAVAAGSRVREYGKGDIGGRDMENMNSWMDIEYLSTGNQTQIDVYQLLRRHRILDQLQKYSPVLVGTVPIEINVADSDLDIICEVYDFEQFEREVRSHFNRYPGFAVSRKTKDSMERIKANFICEKWPIELFGQAMPTVKQNGYKHMVIEARLLKLYGNNLKERIIELKSKGMKTEPAFTQILQMDGNPYQELLKLYKYSDEELRNLWVDPDDAA